MYLKRIKIGNVELENNLILAPMAGVTNLPFRIICEKFGPGMVCTEMASAKAMFHNDEKTKRLLNTDGEKRPISFQIFGSEEESMAYEIDVNADDEEQLEELTDETQLVSGYDELM